MCFVKCNGSFKCMIRYPENSAIRITFGFRVPIGNKFNENKYKFTLVYILEEVKYCTSHRTLGVCDSCFYGV